LFSLGVTAHDCQNFNFRRFRFLPISSIRKKFDLTSHSSIPSLRIGVELEFHRPDLRFVRENY
jgi:hypothetical protein